MQNIIKIVVMVIVVVFAVNAHADVIINETFDNPLTYVRDGYYALNSPTPIDMVQEVKVDTSYLDVPPSIMDGELNTGSCAYDVAQAHQTTAIRYAWNSDIKNVGLSFDYRNERDSYTVCQVMVGFRNDMGDTGQLYTQTILTVSESGTYTLTAADIKAALPTVWSEDDINFIHIEEFNMNNEVKGFFDNVVITGDCADCQPTARYLTIEKEGRYTVDIQEGSGMSRVYVNDTLSTIFTMGVADLGTLMVGDTIHITVDDTEAEIVEQLDWQSWDLYFLNNSVKIYVEDPPLCEPEIVEVEVIVYIDRIVEVEVIVEVLVETIVYVDRIVEVPVECSSSDKGGYAYGHYKNKHGKRAGKVYKQ